MNDLAITDLVAGYGGVDVLSGCDLLVPAGRVAAVFGANGSGKSTLLRAVNGLIRYSGSIVFDGVELAGKPTEEIAARGIAHVLQGRGTFAGLIVEENLRLGASALKNRRSNRARLEDVYSLLPQLSDRRRQIAGLLSGGEQQMLAIGRVLMMQPRPVLLDEPSLGLAPRIVTWLFEMLAGLRGSEQLTFVLVEQNPLVAAKLADIAFLLEGGRVVLSTEPDDPELLKRLRRSHLAVR